MFDSLSQRLSKIVKTMRGQARLTEENTRDMLREVRMALLEADVALPVVREVLARIKEKAMGEEVVGNLNPGQALVGVVQRELTAVIGGDLTEEERSLNLRVQPPAVILLAGLQGAGKTTSAGKLAKYLVETMKKKVLTVSADVYRPAAIDQLKTVTEQAGADWFPSTPNEKPLDIAAGAIDHARRRFYDVLIVDTAGRLAIDEAMMREVAELNTFLKPAETLFVIDAMLGQDAVNTAKAFHERLPLTGIILTKTDGDSRGGAALSVRHVTGKPIKFVGSGEKLTGFDAFDPEAMASRILGMGDIVGLVKDVTKSINIAEAEKLATKLKAGDRFDLNDFRAQLAQMGAMDNFSSILEKLPAQFQEMAGKVNDKEVQKQVRRTMGIIDSMTPLERRKPELIKASRKKRIALGAGVPVQEVNRLLKQFEQTQEMMKRMKKGGLSRMMRALGGMGLPGMGGFGGLKP
ncbi:signal recognition particle protein [Sutterella megalosphaeroides]|uniref:Signal recognition particle protein n=1 Tax=Sutterella megalosphaeroides TaxID=2494234 RepID=A0A2Z6I7X1_9BURK|nr:signal recognition particle protein [Sutterella megalosphaeroides]BBF22533.1 signal recognition particle protein [Sutterella megalosphaeroides]